MDYCYYMGLEKKLTHSIIEVGTTLGVLSILYLSTSCVESIVYDVPIVETLKEPISLLKVTCLVGYRI